MLSPEDLKQVQDLIRIGTTQGNPSQFKSDYGRLLNQTKSFEGGGLLPQPGGGKRLPSVTSLRLLKNSPAVGGAKIAVTWNDEQLTSLDKIQIQVWASGDFALISKFSNPTDINTFTLPKYFASFVFDTAPGEFFIPASQAMTVVITAATLHSSGVVSLPQFQATLAVSITPLAANVEHPTSSFNVSYSIPTTHIVDTTAGSVTATLPPINSCPQGLTHIFKKISSDGNSMTIGGPQNIDGAATLSTPLQYVSYVITADTVSNKWWLIR